MIEINRKKEFHKQLLGKERVYIEILKLWIKHLETSKNLLASQ